MNKGAAVTLWVMVWLVLVSCSGNNKSGVNQRHIEQALPTGNMANLTGHQLAQGYCGSCHLFPEPDLLDKQAWKNGVLPNMALRLGLDIDGANPYVGMDFEEIPVVAQAGVFASEPLISQENWAKIVNYYDSAAPVKPILPKPGLPVNANLALFTPKPFYFKSRKLPLTTLARYNEKTNRLYLGDRNNNLFILDGGFNLLDSLKLESPPSDIQFDAKGGFNLLTLGVLEPSDRNKGGLSRYVPQATGTYTVSPLLQGLNRPVEAAYADLNQDKQEDIVVCNYGNHTGKLAWYANKGNGRYEENVLKAVPGARNVIVRDFNQDGRPDILALVAQASESISIFYNRGQNKFEEKQVLGFPPVYGSSYLEVADFNQDGHPDLLYTNGDNADFSVTLKRYQGVRIYVNDGRNNFKQAWFYPLHGASKAIARDFDRDGDLDIAAISFFPDFKTQPNNSFVYLENQGHLQFGISTTKEATSGRWLTLEASDVDQDGDQDLLLGSFIDAPSVVPQEVQKKWYQSGPNILLLKNNKVKPSLNLVE